jgi:cyclophilin family peptidyl-prolyl cis-trans isomerase
VNCAALEGVIALAARNPGDTTLSSACRALALAHLNSRDVAVTTTAASALGSEGIRDAATVEPLLKRLSALRAPDEIEAIQEITRTLGALRDTSALPALESLLRSPDAASRAAAREAVREITGVEPATGPDTRGDPPYTDFDFDYLRSFPARPRITVETSRGTIALELDRDAAPFTVMSFLKLALGKKFYQGTTFHRVVPNFVVQGGDPRGDGWGGPGYAIRSEFSPLRFDTGVLGIASSGKDTEGCQFFITHSPHPHLDGRYTVFGRVVAGQDVVEQILVGDRILNVGFSDPGAASPGR